METPRILQNSVCIINEVHNTNQRWYYFSNETIQELKDRITLSGLCSHIEVRHVSYKWCGLVKSLQKKELKNSDLVSEAVKLGGQLYFCESP